MTQPQTNTGRATCGWVTQGITTDKERTSSNKGHHQCTWSNNLRSRTMSDQIRPVTWQHLAFPLVAGPSRDRMVRCDWFVLLVTWWVFDKWAVVLPRNGCQGTIVPSWLVRDCNGPGNYSWALGHRMTQPEGCILVTRYKLPNRRARFCNRNCKYSG